MAVNQSAIATQIQAAAASAQAAVATLPSLADATLVELAPVIYAVDQAVAVFENAQAELDADISLTTVGGIVPGQPAPQLVATFVEQVSSSQQDGVLITALSYLSRIQTNLEQATG